MCSFGAIAREVTLSIGDLQAGSVSAQSVKARLRGANLDELDVEAERLTVPGHTWRNLPGEIHTIEALEDSDVLEVSTPEVDDVVRLSDSYGREGTPAH